MKKMNARLVYEIKHASKMLNELECYLQQHPNELLLCMEQQPIPGLPVIRQGTEQVYRGYYYLWNTPWGLAKRAEVEYSSYPQLADMRLQCISEKREDAVVMPEVVVPEIAVAVVNPVTELATVYAAGTERDFENETPVWQGKIPLYTKWSSYNVLAQVQHALALAGAPYYAAKLLVEAVDFPWKDTEGIAVPPAMITNDEVRLPVVGYVYDPDSKEVIFLSLVGNKTAARSIWGSLSTAHRRRLTLEYPNGYEYRMAVSVESSHNYTTYTQPVDDNGLLQMHIVDRRCTSSDDTQAEAVYLVLPHGSTEAEKYAAFAARLDAVLPVGVPAQWGKALYQLGLNNDLVQVCGSGGDVDVAYRLPAEGWLDLINTALQEGQLQI